MLASNNRWHLSYRDAELASYQPVLRGEPTYMKTFEEYYCEATGCSPEALPRKLFWKCLHRHALPIAPFILLFNPEYFSVDRELISEVRRAVKMNQVWEEVREYFVSPKHVGWLRKRGNVRVSARRLINLTREYLPASGSPPSPSPSPYPPPEAGPY